MKVSIVSHTDPQMNYWWVNIRMRLRYFIFPTYEVQQACQVFFSRILIMKTVNSVIPPYFHSVLVMTFHHCREFNCYRFIDLVVHWLGCWIVRIEPRLCLGWLYPIYISEILFIFWYRCHFVFLRRCFTDIFNIKGSD